MEVAALAFPWATLAKRDPRRDGHGDGVKGVYLGELVRMELKNPETPQGQVADVSLAPLRMWTKSPWWDQTLGMAMGPWVHGSRKTYGTYG
eukprot:Skav226284  [mRNA]  locus=scaffold3301:128889:130832:+ [translate_table: standard]